ncbi:Gfo/Idh/MocA family protein [Streptomyces anulatus]|uniref:Gfo/Idh/MocA family protein n=1 Tax=Streptomyces anulatus TaxID=1892 RepID=UPI00332C80F4
MTAALRIGVLGCAEIARRRMLPAFVAGERTELVAVAARDPERAEETARIFGCRAARRYEDVLADPDIEAVYVPLPAALHERWTEAALRAGKHVLAEKPLTTAHRSTARLLKLARSRGLALMENVMFVHHGQHTAVRELVDQGEIGELCSLQAEFSVPALPSGDIRYRPELGGGALWDTGVYPVRAALHLLGPELDVLGAHLTDGPGRTVDTGGAALLGGPDGVTVQLAFGLDRGYRSRYELTGSKGRIVVDRAFTPPADHRPAIRLERSGGAEEISLEAHDQVAATVAAFADAARTGASPDEATTLRQAVLLDDIRGRARRAPTRPREGTTP